MLRVLGVIELPAQPPDMNVNGSRDDIFVVLPDFTEDFLARNHATSVLHQIKIGRAHV